MLGRERSFLSNASMAKSDRIRRILDNIGSFPDWPKPGVIFRDIFPLFKKADVFQDVIDVMVEHIQEKHKDVEIIVGLEARGFLFGPLLALRLKCSFVPLRKKGKLPGKCQQVSYSLEYGEDVIEVQEGVIKPGQKVLIVDDLIATGGTMMAACQMVKKLQGVVVECLVLIELSDLKGKDKLSDPFYSIISFEGE